MRRWRDGDPKQQSGSSRGPSDGRRGARRQGGPQAISLRRGEARRGTDEPSGRDTGQPSVPRRFSGAGAPPLNLEPRQLALLAAGAVGLIVMILIFSFRGSSPESPSATSVPVAAVSPTAAGPTAVPTQGPVQATILPIEPSYTVQSGDTLATIARRFNTTVDALVSMNNLSDRNSLRVGQRLVIPNQ